MITLLITGNTYVLRRQIKSLGGQWNGEHRGWIVPTSKKDSIIDLNSSLIISEVEIPENTFTPLTPEERRAYIQGLRNRKADRLIKSAELRDSEAAELRSQTQPFISDLSFVTQPITPGAGGRSFQKFRNKINNKVDREFSLMNESEELRERAERLKAPVAIKGDAAAKRQAKRDLNDTVIVLGSYINTFIYGKGTVTKINKTTYSVKIDTGFICKVDKSFVELIK